MFISYIGDILPSKEAISRDVPMALKDFGLSISI